MAERAETADRVVPAEVSGLLDERSQIHEWLERLVELKAEATPSVFERVREDYESRLADVGRRLSAHREALEGSLSTHRERVDGLQTERDDRAAELEEAKLRFTVGEYDDEEWSRRRESCEAELARLDGRLEKGHGAVKELEGVLAALRADGPSRVARPSRASRSEREDAAASDEGEGPDVPEEPLAIAERASAAGTASSGEPMEDEAEAAKEEEEGATRGARGAEEGAEPPSGEAEFLDELEFLESLSLDDADRFDAVSAMLEGKADEEGGGDAREGRR